MPPESPRTAREAIPHWIVTIGAASFGAAILEAPRSLADPASCPGLLELVTVIASRTASDVPVATMLLWGNRLATFVAIAIFARLLQTIGSGLVVTSVIAIALAFVPAFAPVLAPSPATAMAAAAAALLFIYRATRFDRRRVASAVWACVAMAMTAAIAPALTLPLTVVSALLARLVAAGDAARARWLAPILTALVVAAFPIVIMSAVPALPAVGGVQTSAMSCVVPVSLSIAGGLGAFTGALGGMTPLALGLAMLGAFALRAYPTDRAAWPLIAFALAPLAAMCWSGGDVGRTLAPTVVGLWCLAAVGLGDLEAALAGRPARRVAALLIGLAVPWQQSARPDVLDAHGAAVLGHDRLTFGQFNEIAGLLPNNSALVVEDAVTDVLARDGLRRLQRRGKSVRMVARDATAVGAALSSSPVFALPHGQSRLQFEAFLLTPVSDPRVSGLAEVRQGGGCAVAGSTWTDLPALQSRGGMAAITPDVRQHWHVVFYVGGDVPVELRRGDWPNQLGLGYHSTAYDRDREGDRRVLDENVRADAAPASHPIFAMRHVTRLEIWRAQGGPAVLPVGYASPDLVIARARSAPGDSPVRVCASFPYEVTEVQIK